MADIVEVIHRITYEVNDEALLKASNIIGKQLDDLGKLGNAMQQQNGQANGAAGNELKKSLEEYKKAIAAMKSLLADAGKTKKEPGDPPPVVPNASLKERIKEDIVPLIPLGDKELPVERITKEIKPVDIKKMPRIPGLLEKLIFGDTADEQDDKKRIKEENKKFFEYYQKGAEAAAKGLQELYERRVKYIDADIAKQKEAVKSARELAAQGNTDVLKAEEEKLAALNREREKFVRRQQVLNAGLALSNAVVAVAKAAAESGPLFPAVIPALIASLIAGYGFVSAATKKASSEGFADGVVGYNGRGGPRDDANWVRISSGESVITAAGTQKNKLLLQAINDGANFRFINPMLPDMLPVLQQPASTGQNNYASAKDLKSLEKKLDEVVYAIEGNKLRQNIFFNEQGVGIMTEKAINKNRKRWS